MILADVEIEDEAVELELGEDEAVELELGEEAVVEL
jgi:hypothetical protein